jgi:hypothetical protein
MSDDEDLDRPIYGAVAIGRAAGMVEADGSVDIRKVYYALENGLLDAGKFGKKWVSTPRRARQHAVRDTAA